MNKSPTPRPPRPPAKDNPGAPLTVKCRGEGAAARTAGKRREDNPYVSNYNRPQARAWQEGWDAAAPPPSADRAVRAAPANRAAPADKHLDPRYFAPAGVDLVGQTYVAPRLLACPSCRRVRLDTMSQACVVQGIHLGIANMKCRACGHTFKAPVEAPRSGPGAGPVGAPSTPR